MHLVLAMDGKRLVNTLKALIQKNPNSDHKTLKKLTLCDCNISNRKPYWEKPNDIKLIY